MGNYSRDPHNRAADARAKRYFAVRMQQGVPVLDADWNLLDDLRRLELEDLSRWSIGDGVPTGSAGFQVVPLAGGGIGTLELRANTAVSGWSTIAIDLPGSTAAAALGFGPDNAEAARFGSSPAQITGAQIGPFTLTNGSTLVIEVDGGAPETVTFASGDFADISAATAAEVAAVILAKGVNVTAAAGAGNDFLIKGGGGGLDAAGRLLVQGQTALIEQDIRYMGQPLYQNADLAALWGVDPVPPLTTPGATDLHVVYLDLFPREITSQDDSDLVDVRIGLETAVRLRREWAVRVALAADYPAVLAARPPDHVYYILAGIQRSAGDARILAEMIHDERETDVSLRREIAYWGLGNMVLVNTTQFRNLLINLRDNVREFITYLTTKLIEPDTAYLAGEITGIGTLSDLAVLADYAVMLVDNHSMGTRGALAFFAQLLDAENRFVNIWETVMLPLVKPTGKVYETNYAEPVGRIKALLTGPAPGGFITVTQALERQNLFEAVRSQEQINMEFGQEIDKPVGFLTVAYLGSTTPLIQKNQGVDLRYELSGSVTPEDAIDVQVFCDWATTIKNGNGTLPFNLVFGPGDDKAEFIVTVQAPNSDTAETTISLQVSARHNSGGLKHVTTQKTLKVGSPPPASEEDYVISIASTNVSQIGGVFQVPTNLSFATFNFRFTNNTNDALTADLEFEPVTSPPWTIQQGSFGLDDQVIPALSQEDYAFRFKPPPTAGQSLTFVFRAKDATTSNVVAEIQITLESVNP